MIVGEASDLTCGEAYRGDGGNGNEASWALGGSRVGNNTVGYYSAKVVGYAPNSQVFWKYVPWDQCVPCETPAVNTYVQSALKSTHPGGVQAAMADGSVTFINDSVNIEVLKDLADRSDGHAPGNNQLIHWRKIGMNMSRFCAVFALCGRDVWLSASWRRFAHVARLGPDHLPWQAAEVWKNRVQFIRPGRQPAPRSATMARSR